MKNCEDCKHYVKIISNWCCRLYGQNTCEEEREDKIKNYQCCGPEAKYFEKPEKEWSRIMKKLFLILTFLILIFGFAHVAITSNSLYLVAPPYTYTLETGQTLSYNVQGLPTSLTTANNILPDPTGTYAFALDISSIASGPYIVTATVCLNDPMQGQVCSSPSNPFSFNRIGSPAALLGPLGLSTKQ